MAVIWDYTFAIHLDRSPALSLSLPHTSSQDSPAALSKLVLFFVTSSSRRDPFPALALSRQMLWLKGNASPGDRAVLSPVHRHSCLHEEKLSTGRANK